MWLVEALKFGGMSQQKFSPPRWFPVKILVICKCPYSYQMLENKFLGSPVCRKVQDSGHGTRCDKTYWDAILSKSTGSLSEYKLNNLIQFIISAKYIYHRVAKLQGPT